MSHPRRYYWSARGAMLDPERDYTEIVRILTSHEFPWDITRALGYALFRTFAVPSIGTLLAQTGEFTERPQKRYDDTALLLAGIVENGFDSIAGRSAIRRINQMHRSYDISNDDMRYVLATFVVVPKRWLDDYGWRPMLPHEVRAGVNYYRALGRHMGIHDIPETYEQFETLLNEYESEHFGYTPGGRTVADATLALMSSFYPRPLRALIDRFSLAMLDEPLRSSLNYHSSSPAISTLAHVSLRLRAQFLRWRGPRMQPALVQDLPEIRSYRDGFEMASLGTFPTGCPVPHRHAGPTSNGS